MSEGPDLQFDKAEYETAPAAGECVECHRGLVGHYYDVSGRTVCEACRYAIESRESAGSPAGRLLRATGAGLVAALAGAILYYAILAISGYEFGLIAIVVGFAVGAAVRWGSNGRGGWAYQSLAMVLTYLAIVSAYVPPLIQAVAQQTPDAVIDQQAADAGARPATPTGESGATAEPVAVQTESTDEAIGSPLAGVLILIGIVLALPFLAGFENIIGIVIIGIGLYEAWKLNRRQVLTITGPHTIARAPSAPASA
jgi:hypothetical protein